MKKISIDTFCDAKKLQKCVLAKIQTFLFRTFCFESTSKNQERVSKTQRLLSKFVNQIEHLQWIYKVAFLQLSLVHKYRR